MFEVYKTTLQLMKTREQYDKLRQVVKKNLIDTDVRRALSALDHYWRDYPEHDIIVPETFLAELNIKNPDLDESQLKMYRGMVDIMMQEPDTTTAKGLLRSLRTIDFADKLERLHEQYHTGLDVDLHDEVRDLLLRFESDISRDERVDYCRDSILDIINEDQTGHNLRWFLPSLAGAMPNCRTGDQIIFAARPGKGKTSFYARQAVYVSSQTPDDRPVLWLNNESKAAKIKGTLYRAALKTDFNGIIKMGADRAHELFAEITGGQDRIKVFDVHGRDFRFLEQLIIKHQPAVVIFDMLDNVHGFADAARTDLRLEQLYQWAREQAVIHDFLSLPTSQISVEGEGLAWCDQSMLKDSKTAKQGACDAIITMGAVNNVDKLWSRYIYVPKTKQTAAPGFRSDCATEVTFDGPRCQFIEATPAENGKPNC
jgi:replicative DNA helicase